MSMIWTPSSFGASASSPLILPNGLPSKLRKEPLSKEDVRIVTEFESWCRRRNLQFSLICSSCLEAGDRDGCFCSGSNDRHSSAYHIRCAHADRVYGEAV